MTGQRKYMLTLARLVIAVVAVGSAPAGAGSGSGYPAAVAEGNWVSDAKMSSDIAKAPTENYWWVGRMWGQIDETGKVNMQAANGCTFSGLLVEKSLEGLRGEVEASGCQVAGMNRRYRAVASGGPVDGRGVALKISFRMSKNGGGNGLLDVWSIEGSFVRYQPTN